MSVNQNDYVIDNGSGKAVREDIEDAFKAVAHNNRGGTEPAVKYHHQFWADTSDNIFKIRNNNNGNWTSLFKLTNATATSFYLADGTVNAPSLFFADDTNTGIFSSGADTFNVATAGVERLELGATTIFNEDGADVDFRIEGDTDANLFYLDAGNNRIGIGTASPATKLHVSSSSDTIVRVTSADGSGAFLDLGDVSDPDGGRINYDTGSNLIFNTASTERLRIDSSGRVGIGTFSPSQILHINKSGASTEMRIENGNADFLIQAGNAGDDGLHFYDMDNTAYRMMIANSGNVGIGTITPATKLDVNGNVRASGVLFGSDTAAANTLDDYEEGTWTPDLTFGDSNTGITYTSRAGTYTKVGRQVTVNFQITLSDKGSQSGTANIAGLPFSVADLLSGTTLQAHGPCGFWTAVTDSSYIVFSAISSTTKLRIGHTEDKQDNTSNMANTDFTDTSLLRGSVTYFTAT